ncbi:MAG: DUF3109 family protein [Bacteroidetes bacterium]|nr:DUF3109 family protein [Bacteroidota bacterium]
MIVNGKVIISEDIRESRFICDLTKCKGACCVDGELGAPLAEDELQILDEIYEIVKPYLTEAGKNAIETQGKYVFDEDREYSTPTVNGKECAFAIYNNNGILKCGIEQAYNDKKITFRKPISCHLYPVRITKYDSYDALNYDRWVICSDACVLGEKLKIPLYKFVKDALIRKYGKVWYDQLVREMESVSTKISDQTVK